MKKWTLNSWRNHPVKHIPKYEDENKLDMVLKKVSTFPPLVFAGETRSLKKSLARVVEGKAFLLQAGDCAESFAEFHPDNIRDTFKVILQLALIEEGLPVVILAPKDRYCEKTISNMQEVIARGGKVILISNETNDIISENVRFTLAIPKTDDNLTPFLMTIPLQLLAYHVASLKNCDIDKPRNLAKSVTVE